MVAVSCTGDGRSPISDHVVLEPHLLDAIGAAYEKLRLTVPTKSDSVFRDLVLARIVESTSKVDSLFVLEEVGVTPASYATVKRRLPTFAQLSSCQALSAACAAHAGLGPASLVLYDESTLYFETDGGDGFREPGFSNVIGTYHQLWRLEKSSQMSKHDLQARPIYRHKRESIDAHLTIVFAALAVTHWIENQTVWSIKKFVRAARRYRTIQIRAGQQILTAADPLPEDLHQALTAIHPQEGVRQIDPTRVEIHLGRSRLSHCPTWDPM